MRTIENTTVVKMATVMSGGSKAGISCEELYIATGDLPTDTMRNLPVVASNFRKQLTELEILLRDELHRDIEGKFVGLRLVVELPNGKHMSVKVQTLGKNGLFALAVEGTKLGETLKYTEYKGYSTKDYRPLFDNSEFMASLAKRLEGVIELVAKGNLTITLSKDIEGFSRKHMPYVAQMFDLPPKTI